MQARTVGIGQRMTGQGLEARRQRIGRVVPQPASNSRFVGNLAFVRGIHIVSPFAKGDPKVASTDPSAHLSEETILDMSRK
jgi:hypothetical protein